MSNPISSLAKEFKRTGSKLVKESKRPLKQLESAFEFDFTPDVPQIDIPQVDATETSRAAEDVRRRRSMARGRASTIVGSRQPLG